MFKNGTLHITDEKNWGKEIKVIKRYLKNVDDEQFGKELVWLKNEIINAKLVKSARRATK